MRLLLAACWAAFLFSCASVPGSLEVERAVRLTDSRGRTAEFAGGSHAATIRRQKNPPRLVMEVESAGGDRHTIHFAIPESIEFPEAQGRFQVDAAQNGQPYDLAGRLDTETAEGPPIREWEPCTYDRTHTICGGELGCRTVYYAERGRRDVEYFVRQETLTVELSLIEPGSGARPASFRGGDTLRGRVYTYQGRCF